MQRRRGPSHVGHNALHRSRYSRWRNRARPSASRPRDAWNTWCSPRPAWSQCTAPRPPHRGLRHGRRAVTPLRTRSRPSHQGAYGAQPLPSQHSHDFPPCDARTWRRTKQRERVVLPSWRDSIGRGPWFILGRAHPRDEKRDVQQPLEPVVERRVPAVLFVDRAPTVISRLGNGIYTQCNTFM